jgi:undecaprenyl-diphosphatase
VIGVLGLGPVLLGGIVAFVSAMMAIRFLVATLVRFGLGPFAVYRLMLALGLLLTLGW